MSKGSSKRTPHPNVSPPVFFTPHNCPSMQFCALLFPTLSPAQPASPLPFTAFASPETGQATPAHTDLLHPPQGARVSCITIS